MQDNFMSHSPVLPNRPFGKRMGKESSSQSLSVINDTGCLFSPGAILKTCLPVDLSQSVLSGLTG